MATVEPDKNKKKQHRSPAYPSMGLKSALEHAGTIYKQEKRTAAPVAVVAAHCGTDIKSSKGLRLIAALKQFGLVVEEGGGEDREVRLSEKALDIMLADNEEQKEAAIKWAALAPPLHKKIWDNYKGELPSDATLRNYLLRTLNFNDTYVGRFIKQFRATLRFAGLEAGDTIEESEDGSDLEDESPAVDLMASDPFQKIKAKGHTGATMRELPITLPSLNIAVLRVPTPMTELDFTTLLNSLAAWKDALVPKPQREPLRAKQLLDDEGDDGEPEE